MTIANRDGSTTTMIEMSARRIVTAAGEMVTQEVKTSNLVHRLSRKVQGD